MVYLSLSVSIRHRASAGESEAAVMTKVNYEYQSIIHILYRLITSHILSLIDSNSEEISDGELFRAQFGMETYSNQLIHVQGSVDDGQVQMDFLRSTRFSSLLPIFSSICYGPSKGLCSFYLLDRAWSKCMCTGIQRNIILS